MCNKRLISGLLAVCVLFCTMRTPEVKAAQTGEMPVVETATEPVPPSLPVPEETCSTPTEPEKQNTITFAGEIPDDFVVPFAKKPSQTSNQLQGGLPSSFDSRDTGVITGIKDQTPWQLCWAFSALSVGESYLIKNGWDTGVDLSERHLGCYFHGDAVDPLGNAAGDGTYLEEDYRLSGNNNKFTTFALANWVGGASESKYPYAEEISGQDRSAAMDDIVHLQNAYWINGQDRDNIKYYVMKNGSVGISVYYLEAFYNPETAAYYNDQYTATNHAITIVGWDDQFPAANFQKAPEADGAWLCKNSVGTQFGQDGYFWLSYYDRAISHANATAFVFEFVSAQRYQSNYHHDGSFGTGVQVLSDGGAIANVYRASNADHTDEQILAVGFAVADTDIDYSIQIYRNLEEGAVPDSGIPALSSPQTGQTHQSGVYTIELNEPVRVCSGERFSVVVTLSNPSGGNVRYFVDRSYSNGAWIRFVSQTEQGESFALEDGIWTDLAQTDETARIKAFTVQMEETSISRLWFEQEQVLLAPGQTFCQQPCWLPENAQAGTYIWQSDEESVAHVAEDGLVSAVGAGRATITAATPDMGISASYQVTVKPAIHAINLLNAKEQMVTGEIFTPQAEILPASAAPYYTLTIESSDETVIRVEDGALLAVSPGTAAIGISADTYRATYTVTVTKPIQNGQIQTQPVIFDGAAAITPVAVWLDGVLLEEGADYTLAFSHNTKPGTGIVTVTGCGHYSGTLTGEYSIYIPGPVTLEARNQSNGIRVSWESVTGADGYRIYRRKGSGSWTKVASVSGGSRSSWLDTDAESGGTVYTYRVQAYVKSGKKIYTGPNSEEVRQCRLAAVKIKSVTQSNEGFRISWKKLAGATAYCLLRQVDGQNPEVIARTETGSVLTLTDKTATEAGRQYTYTVVAEKWAGEQCYQGAVSAAKTLYLPETPVIQSVVNGEKGIMLSWEPVEMATGYEIQRSRDGSAWSKVKALTGGDVEVWTDTACISGKTYYYRVLALNREGVITCRGQSSEPVWTCRLYLPRIGTISQKESGLSLAWRAVPGADSYVVYRSTDGAAPERIACLAGGIFPRYVDPDAREAGCLYTYTVSAQKEAGEQTVITAISEARSARIPPIPDLQEPTNAVRGIKISWSGVENATGYEIQRSRDGSYWYKAGTVTSGTVTSWTDSSCKSGSTYSYRILATAILDGNRFQSEPSQAVTAGRLEPPVIKNLTKTADGITVSWKRVTGAEGYRVFRSENGSQPVEVGSTDGKNVLRYRDQTANEPGIRYTYLVVAEMSGEGQDFLSAPSAEKTLMVTDG